MKRPEQPATPGERNVYIALALAAAVGVILRAIYLNKACYEIEQATWVFFAKQPAPVMFEWVKTEVTGVLDLLIRHPMLAISDNPAFLKSYQIILLLPVIWYVYRLSELIFEDARPGVAAAFMTAMSPLCINHAQLLRYHSLAMFASVGAVYYFTAYVKGGKKRNMALFAAFYFLGAATHYYPVILLPALALGTLAGGIRGRFSIKRGAAACVAGGAALCALAPFFASQYGRHVGGAAARPSLINYVFSRALLNIPDAFLQLSLGTHYHTHSHFALARILLLGAVIAYTGAALALMINWKLWFSGGGRTFFAIATVSAIALPFLTVPFAGALYVAKYLTPFAPLFFLLFAGAVFDIKAAVPRGAVFASLFCVMSVSTVYYYSVLGPRPSFKDAIEFIGKTAEPDDTVVIAPGYYYMLFDIYSPVRGKLLSVPQGDFTRDKSKTKELITNASMERFANEYLAGKRRLWVFYGDGSGERERIPMDPGGIAFKWFESRYKPVMTYRFFISPIRPGDGVPLGIARLYERR